MCRSSGSKPIRKDLAGDWLVSGFASAAVHSYDLAGAYIAEIVRGSFLSVHKGLREAGLNLRRTSRCPGAAADAPDC